MQVVNLVQGSPEWHAHRRNHFNASDAPAMMGVSPYKARDQLLHEMATGLTKEVDAGTQKRFDDGHKFEALARPLAEKIIGEELSPTVGVEGKYSASFDGITFNDDVIFEHKTLNDDLRAAFHNQDPDTVELPLMYRVQMEQQLMISGSEKCLFMASKWNGEKLDEEKNCWYWPDLELRKEIIAGWDQFERDLAAYVPPVQVEKVVAETVKTLPVPSVIVRGEITASNLDEIIPQFDAYLEGVKTELATDQDFADAEANAKNCRETAKRIEALQENIIGQMVSVNEANSILENYKKAFNALGLRLEKAVKEQKETIKTMAIMKAKQEFADYQNSLQDKCAVLLHHFIAGPDFAAAIKGVKTLESMQSRINDELAKAKAHTKQFVDEANLKIEFIKSDIRGYEHLINVADLATKDLDYIKLHIQSVKDAEDKRKADYEAQVKAQAEANARAKIEAEKRAAESVTAPNPAPVTEQSTRNPLPGNLEQQFQEHVAQPIKAAATRTAPTANQIIEVVANHFAVDKSTAQKWLIKIDFAGMMKAAA